MGKFMLHRYFAHAKINWSLNVVGRRADGYHLLDMLMQSIALADTLCVEDAQGLSLLVDGAPAGEENLVMRAALALNRAAGARRGARLTLNKRVPARAGLGGGSGDCAAALRALNGLWGLDLPEAELMDIGLSLGADVPFCLTGGLARVSGIGEVVEPLANAPRIPLVLLVPGGGLSTGAVFSLWDAGGFPDVALDVSALSDAVVRRDLPAVDKLCANALAAPALSLLPEIGTAMDELRKQGASAAFMTGSGSAVVGAFDSPAAARRAAAALPGAILTETVEERRIPLA